MNAVRIGVLLVATCLRAQAATPSITVDHAWSRATIPGAKTGVIYMTIVDHGAPDTLVSVATPVAGMAQMHRSVAHDHVAEMLPVAELPVTASHPAVFSPGGYHVMLTELKQKLVQGQSFPITLTFAHAGQVQAEVRVQALGATADGDADMGGMDMKMR